MKDSKILKVISLVVLLSSIAAYKGDWRFERSDVIWVAPYQGNVHEFIGTMQWISGSKSTVAEFELQTWHEELQTTTTTEVVTWMKEDGLVVEFVQVEPSYWQIVAQVTLPREWKHDLLWMRVQQTPGPGRRVTIYDCDRNVVVMDKTCLLRDPAEEGETYAIVAAFEYWDDDMNGVVEIIPQYANGVPWYASGMRRREEAPVAPHHNRELFNAVLTQCEGPTAASAILAAVDTEVKQHPVHVRPPILLEPETAIQGTTSPDDEYDFFIYMPLVLRQIIIGVRYSYNLP